MERVSGEAWENSIMKSISRGHTRGFIRVGFRDAAILTALFFCISARAQAPTGPDAPPSESPQKAAQPESPSSGSADSSPSTTASAASPPAGSADPVSATPESKPAFVKTVGGHIGIATPLVTVASETKTIGDQFTILNPIGIGFHVSDDWIVDFETVVANPINPTGTTGLVVDPGIIHSFGRVALGLRLAFQINHDTNVGGIPLVNVGLVDLGGATWFIEAAFPTFYSDKKGEFNAVLHTGIGF